MGPISEDNETDGTPINLEQPPLNSLEPPTIVSSTSSPYSKPFFNMSYEKRVTINEQENTFSGVTTPPKP